MRRRVIQALTPDDLRDIIQARIGTEYCNGCRLSPFHVKQGGERMTIEEFCESHKFFWAVNKEGTYEVFPTGSLKHDDGDDDCFLQPLCSDEIDDFIKSTWTV